MSGGWRSASECLAKYLETQTNNLELPMSLSTPVEFIGYIGNNNSSETIVRSGPVLDRHWIETVAQAHEAAGFDRALLAFHSTTPDGLQIGQHVLHVTDRLNVLIAQRPGFTAPTLLARQLATVDELSGGRVALHVITGGNATELRQDGNTVDDKDERYARTSEFLDVVRCEWTSDKPFNYAGKYYQVENGFSQIKPTRREGIPIFVGGASDAAIEVAGKHADTFALWGESYAQVRDVTSRVRSAAARHGRPTPRFSLSVRPILAETEEKAWAKAEAILERATALQDKTGYRKPADGHATAGARRLLALADQGSRIDKRLWTEIAELTGANSNTTALVGTPEQVADVFGDYYDLGVSHFLIRGFDPLIDAIDYGRELIPLTRKLIAGRRATRGVAAE
jgi:alkanesulfonate monooxygenase